MQFSIVTTILFACATLFVSASPIPVPAPFNPVVAEILPRENVADVPLAREADPEPLPICTKFQCN
ncbi:hypothetical protein BDZ97DRAFT_1924642 [Flammula alnicola]|nr:hypothetical protein BDZ97DRAFT_1924642 [Flammula alnicola]